MQIDLGDETIVAGVVTQGRSESTQGMTEFAVKYSMDNMDWSDINSDLQGSTSGEHLTQEFPSMVMARYIRIFPQNWEGHISMRAGLLVCAGDSGDSDERGLQELSDQEPEMQEAPLAEL